MLSSTHPILKMKNRLPSPSMGEGQDEDENFFLTNLFSYDSIDSIEATLFCKMLLNLLKYQVPYYIGRHHGLSKQDLRFL